MGMPGGSFLAGTKYSYVGDLIERAGGKVVTTSSSKSDYVQPNTEQIAKEQPDVIITMAHAMDQSVLIVSRQSSSLTVGKTSRLLRRTMSTKLKNQPSA
ncbi:Staphylococcal iron-regulated protein F [Weissella viridescens]|uniref:Staphylococcal iron-regulated protein F n=1 Tax=Weissella viridescens TaxID=1629 RepID=A0A380NXQ3_WEIVI|nr:Staphylococcal iron-regulated protein F [Weissella viridescens]